MSSSSSDEERRDPEPGPSGLQKKSGRIFSPDEDEPLLKRFKVQKRKPSEEKRKKKSKKSKERHMDTTKSKSKGKGKGKGKGKSSTKKNVPSSDADSDDSSRRASSSSDMDDDRAEGSGAEGEGLGSGSKESRGGAKSGSKKGGKRVARCEEGGRGAGTLPDDQPVQEQVVPGTSKKRPSKKAPITGRRYSVSEVFIDFVKEKV